MEVLEHAKETYYTLARYISKGSESEWLWISHSKKDRSYTYPDSVQHEASILNAKHPVKDSPYFVVKVVTSQKIERVDNA